MAPTGLLPRAQHQKGELLHPILQQNKLVCATTKAGIGDPQGLAGETGQAPQDLIEPRRHQVNDQGKDPDEDEGGNAALASFENAHMAGHPVHAVMGDEGGEQQVQVRPLVAEERLRGDEVGVSPLGQGAARGQPIRVQADQDPLIVRVHQGDGAIRGQQAPLGGDEKVLIDRDQDHQAAHDEALAILDGVAHQQEDPVLEDGKTRNGPRDHGAGGLPPPPRSRRANPQPRRQRSPARHPRHRPAAHGWGASGHRAPESLAARGGDRPGNGVGGNPRPGSRREVPGTPPVGGVWLPVASSPHIGRDTGQSASGSPATVGPGETQVPGRRSAQSARSGSAPARSRRGGPPPAPPEWRGPAWARRAGAERG
jgi:hypothetical protein